MRLPWKKGYELVFAWGVSAGGETIVWGILYKNGREVERAVANGFPFQNYKGREQVLAFADWLDRRNDARS